jgi:hypothetical protein
MAAIFSILPPLSLYAQEITLSGVIGVYNPGTKDLRLPMGLTSRSGNKPVTGGDLKNLRIGDVFVNENGSARVVVALQKDSRGRTIIETAEPRIDDVFEMVYVPDFEVNLGIENFHALDDGVEIVSSRTIDDPPDLFKSGKMDSLTRSQIQWLETDPRVEGMLADGSKISTFRFKKTFELSSGGEEKADWQKTAMKWKDRAATVADVITGEDSGVGDFIKGDKGFETGAGINLLGVVNIVGPNLKGGLLKPAIKISWITFKVLGIKVSLPYIDFDKGYASLTARFAEQLDLRVEGYFNKKIVKEYVLGEAFIGDGFGIAKAYVKLMMRYTLEGTIIIGLELSEYSMIQVSAKTDLIWPFIPTKPSISLDEFYINAAFRPYFEAKTEQRLGPAIVPGFTLLGIDVLTVDAFGGVYLMVNGYVEPLSIMGTRYDHKGVYPSGGYGNFRDWILYVQAEAGGFANINLDILGIWNKDLLDKKWPFWYYANQWEF